MNKQDQIKIFTEELWQNVISMMAGDVLTHEEVLQVWEVIRARLACGMGETSGRQAGSGSKNMK